MGGILTILGGMFVVLVIGIIHRRGDAGGGRIGYGESDNVCAVRDDDTSCKAMCEPHSTFHSFEKVDNNVG